LKDILPKRSSFEAHFSSKTTKTTYQQDKPLHTNIPPS